MNPEATPAHQVLTMATLNGAKALGMEDLIGSLEVGKFGDIIAVELNDFSTVPLYNPLSHLVYCATREQYGVTPSQFSHLSSGQLRSGQNDANYGPSCSQFHLSV